MVKQHRMQAHLMQQQSSKGPLEHGPHNRRRPMLFSLPCQVLSFWPSFLLSFYLPSSFPPSPLTSATPTHALFSTTRSRLYRCRSSMHRRGQWLGGAPQQSPGPSPSAPSARARARAQFETASRSYVAHHASPRRRCYHVSPDSMAGTAGSTLSISATRL